MMPLSRFAAGLALALAASAGAAAAQQPGSPAEASAIERAAAARIRPGDRVIVRVWREPLLSDTAAIVNERAEVTLPRLGVIHVGSHSAISLRDSLRARYATFLRDPVVEVTVLRRIVVNGEVAEPGVYYVDIATALRDVIAQAGGIRESGDAKKVYIVRGGRRLPARDWQRDGSPAADLHSGDQVVVSRRSWLTMNALALASAAGALASLIVVLR